MLYTWNCCQSWFGGCLELSMKVLQIVVNVCLVSYVGNEKLEIWKEAYCGIISCLGVECDLELHLDWVGLVAEWSKWIFVCVALDQCFWAYIHFTDSVVDHFEDSDSTAPRPFILLFACVKSCLWWCTCVSSSSTCLWAARWVLPLHEGDEH